MGGACVLHRWFIGDSWVVHVRFLQVQAVLLDDVFASPDRPVREMACDLDTLRLRECREVLESRGCAEGYAYVNQHHAPLKKGTTNPNKDSDPPPIL
jgi:hypothetical protein